MNEGTEERHIARGAGKWSQPGVPHRGWTCTGIDDLGAPDSTCEMCESQSIRYVHYMSHPDYPDELAVGCVCAGHMEQDYEAAKRRERGVRNAARRRIKWLNRRWRTSAKGNAYINADGFNVVVYRLGATWSGRITNRETGHGVRLRRPCATLDEAKLAAFDGMVFLKQQRSPFD